MATWAKGIDFKNTNNTKRIGGVGIYGTDTSAEKLYIGMGTEPWNNTGLQLTNSAINFKGNKIYHAGDKPTASEIGAAASSHTHTTLLSTGLSGQTVSLNNYTLSSGSPQVAYYYCPTDGGGSGITGRPDDNNKHAFYLRVELIRWASSSDYISKQTYIRGNEKIMYVRYCTNGTWTSWEKVYTSNNKPTASEIGAAASSHTHNYMPHTKYTTTQDANNIKTTGVYSFNATCTNAATSNHGTLIAEFNVGTPYQLWIPDNANIIYKRNYTTSSGTWGSWNNTLANNISGNASTATTLQTARTLTIGNTGKSFNGSGNVSWSLSEIGAAASNHTHSYIPLSGSTGITGVLRSNSEIQTTSQNAFRAVSGNYGFFIRNDGSNTYFLLTNSGDQYGNWNSLRPLSVNNATGVVTFGNGLKGTLDGNSATATKLQTARAINGTNFDGSANITTANWGTARSLNGVSVNGSTNYTIPVENYSCSVGDNNTNLYHRILTTDIATTNWVDKSLIIVMHSGYQGGGFGIAKITLRTNDISSAANSHGEIKWLVRSGFAENALVFNLVNEAKNACMDVFYKSPGTYAGMTWYVLSEGGRGGNHSKLWTKYNTNASGTNAYTEANMKTLRKYTSTLVSAKDAGQVSTANSASTLSTARTINGTSFNGSANITTANWGTARNIQIGNTAKSVNGSANVSWSLSEIGAAASSHTHNSLTTKGTNTINSTTNDTTSNWGAHGNSVHWYTTNGCLNNQPSQYGYLLNIGSNSEVHQLWMTQSSGNLAHRGGNASGWNGTWRTILDSSNYNSYSPTKTGGGASGTWGISVSGNANTATTLQTARTINGTSFNGSGNITTANWGTARTLTIGNTGKSVNGSGNVSWSLSEIGALPLSGGTLTGETIFNNYLSLNASSSGMGGTGKGQLSYDGMHKELVLKNISDIRIADNGALVLTSANPPTSVSGNAGTATKLKTARAIKIGNTSRNFDGSGNVTWTLSDIGAAANRNARIDTQLLVDGDYDSALKMYTTNYSACLQNIASGKVLELDSTGKLYYDNSSVFYGKNCTVTTGDSGRQISFRYPNGMQINVLRYTTGTLNMNSQSWGSLYTSGAQSDLPNYIQAFSQVPTVVKTIEPNGNNGFISSGTKSTTTWPGGYEVCRGSAGSNTFIIQVISIGRWS